MEANVMKIKYKIYQKPFGSLGLFEVLACMATSVKINLDEYQEIWSGTIKSSSIKQGLEDLFYIFNMQPPPGYASRSLSVSDVVEINGEYYYCQAVGWLKVEI